VYFTGRVDIGASGVLPKAWGGWMCCGVVRVGPGRCYVLWCCESGSGALLGAQDNSVAVLYRCFFAWMPGRGGKSVNVIRVSSDRKGSWCASIKDRPADDVGRVQGRWIKLC